MADPSNPYLPDKLSTLGMMLTGLGSGIGAAASRNLPFYFGVAPGAEAFQNGYNNVVNRGLNYDLARKNYDLNASYKNMQERMIDLQSQALQNKLQMGKELLKQIPSLSGGGQPGMNVQPPVMGPDSTPTAIPPGVQMRMPQINQAASQYGVRPELAAGMLSQESGGDPNAVSPAGAQGIAQLQPGTARDLGVSDPKDPGQAIPGGVNYLGQMIRKYNGNETLGLMAYNWGPGNVDNWIKSGADPAKIPAETRNYVQKVNGYASSGQPQQTSPRAAPQPNGMPPMPGPPPNTTGVQVLAGLSGMPEVGTALAAYPQSLYKYNVDQYNRQFEAQKYRQSSAQSPVLVGPNGETSPNRALIGADAEKAAAVEQAKAKAHTDYLFPDNLSGNDLLDRLPANVKGVVQDLGKGDLAMSDLPQRMASSGLDPSKIDVYSLAKRVYGDQFNIRTGEMRKDFYSYMEPQKDGGKIAMSVANASQHLADAAEAYNELRNGHLPVANKWFNELATQAGWDKQTSFETIKQAIGTEIAKVVSGGSDNSVTEREANRDILSAWNSPDQMAGVFKRFAGLIEKRRNTLYDQADKVGLPKDFVDKSIGKSGTTALSSLQNAVLPSAALKQLKEGMVTPFNNGQKWTLRAGVPTRVE